MEKRQLAKRAGFFTEIQDVQATNTQRPHFQSQKPHGCSSCTHHNPGSPHDQNTPGTIWGWAYIPILPGALQLSPSTGQHLPQTPPVPRGAAAASPTARGSAHATRMVLGWWLHPVELQIASAKV